VRRILGINLLAVLCFLVAVPASSQRAGSQLERAFSGVNPNDVPTGILYDRVLPMSNIGAHDGSAYRPLSRPRWRQIYDELYRASLTAPSRPRLDELDARVRRPAPGTPIPIAVLNYRYDRLTPGALDRGDAVLEDGRVVIERPGALAEHRAFAATAFIDHTYRGGLVSFLVDRSWYFANDPAGAPALEVDFGDGAGFRPVAWGERVSVAYASTGEKTLRVRAASSDGSELRAGFVFRVVSLQAPTPDDTISVAATIPYNGEYGTGEAYVYLADTHTSLTQPVVMVEGFDIDNNMNWDELYALLDKENLIETVRADGYDIVVLNFTDATDYIQKNSFALVDLLEKVQAAIDPRMHYVLVGASMGGLCARYALSYMETNAIPHRVNTYISFDTPHEGANIPLGIQYWLDFFQSQSADAAALLASLDRPAARQMLVYHHTTPPGTTGESDSLRADFDADLAALGDFPSIPRKVAMANGSGTMMNQGFNPGDQIIQWEYSGFLVHIIGDIWAVPDGTSTQIFEGLIDPIIGSTSSENVTVSGTSPYDNAPGGWRNSMAQMDSTQAPYGDIVALYDNHCFIPVISALDLATGDLFYDVAGDPSILSITPFDAVYFPAENQPHVDITPENAQWILDEVLHSPTAVASRGATPMRATLDQNFPNPFNPSTVIRYTLPRGERVRLSVYDVRGALVATLFDGTRPAGPGEVRWHGTDDNGNRVGSGVYFCRLRAGDELLTHKMVLVQ
jgi:hypothetical protein